MKLDREASVILGSLDRSGIGAVFGRVFPDAAMLIFDRELKVTMAAGRVPTREEVGASRVEGSASSRVLIPGHWHACEPLFRAALDGEPGLIEIDELEDRGSFRVVVEPLRNGAGAVIGGVCVWRDITERSQQDEELEQRGRLLDLAHDAIIVREPARSAVTYWNREASETYGYSAAQAHGRVTHELLATEFPVSKQSVDDALRTRGRWVGELRHRRADGRWIVVSSRQALVRNDRGEPIAVIELNSDITERKLAEHDLRVAEQRFRALIESAPEAMVITDEGETIMLVNDQAEKLFGYSRAELIGKPIGIILPGGLRASRQFGERTAESDPLPIGFGPNLLARQRDGREFAVETSVSALETESEFLISASIRDVSRQLLRQLQQALVPRLKISARWQVEWRYRPAVRAMLLAGDFIGVAERPDGSLALLIGDVAGHGAVAAGTGATLRAAWLGATQSALAMESIPGLLHRLLVTQATQGAVTMATACLAEIDPRASELRLIRAGHDSPLLITPDKVVELNTAHGPALGLSGPVDWPLEQVPLERDAAIMLYTDGLTERRARPGSSRQYLELAPRIDRRTMLDEPPGEALDRLLEAILPADTEELEDDAAAILLNLRRTANAESVQFAERFGDRVAG